MQFWVGLREWRRRERGHLEGVPALLHPRVEWHLAGD